MTRAFASAQRAYDAAELPEWDACEDGMTRCEACGGRGVDPRAGRRATYHEDEACEACSGDGVVPCDCEECSPRGQEDDMDEAELVEQLTEVVYILAQGVSHDAGVTATARASELGDAVVETVRTSRELADVSLMLWRVASGEAEDVEIAEARVLCDAVLRGGAEVAA